MSQANGFSLVCPVPIDQYPAVTLAHGGGGKLMNQLITDMFVSVFENGGAARHDSIALASPGKKIAFTTDSFVVKPLFFPGGSIGELAVYGTVNDLAMSGAKPLYLSAGFIIEEGFPMETLWRVVQAMAQAAGEADVKIVTGDTKVVDRGKGDEIFINTSGIGVIEHDLAIDPTQVKPGDAIVLSGDLGRHGMAIMAVREGLEFESRIESDAAPLWEMVQTLLSEKLAVHCLRDLTRGGLASALNEIAEGSQTSMVLEETAIPVREDVRAACEILGLDPLHVANEGRFVLFVPSDQSGRAVELLKSHPSGKEACVIGTVSKSKGPPVTMKSRIGSTRIVDMLSGEQLPRIC